MIDRQQLLKDLQGLLPRVEQDILAYTESKPELTTHLEEEYTKAKEAKRTAEHFVAWREAQITQAAVAWILTCVFVRFLEDNELLDEPLISGPAGSRLQHARDRLTVYFRDNPTHAEREYLLSLFEELEQLPVMAELLDHRHNPLWQLPVSADGARRLIDFFQKLNPETGDIVHDFTDKDWDTRFLGDLYQDLSESVRKRYALLQTPEFVESFILDYTLEKAKETFGLPGLRLIDPTCGSGHFLLTTFERLFDDWIKREPSTNSRALAQRALDAVYGVDINPYAIAVARFRLLIAAMKAAGSDKIKNAPDFHFNLAVGDSLLHGRRHESQGQGIQSDMMDDPIAHVLEVEDKDKLEKILGQRYHVVVGNPPYIIVRDKALNKAYRDKYPTCHRKYSLGVPFTERFFDLCMAGENARPAGFVGMITANSFMKREFGKKLIAEYFPRKELTYIIDTSGAYIPGHGTPTVILFARNQMPRNELIRVVMGKKAEPETPANPQEGKVWSAINELIERTNSDNEYITVEDKERGLFDEHPWSLSGGGAFELKKILYANSSILLEDISDSIGFGCILGEDEAFCVPIEKVQAARMPNPRRHFISGRNVRDWSYWVTEEVLFPYDEEISLINDGEVLRWLWPLKTILWNRTTFSKETYRDSGRMFYEFHQLPADRNKSNNFIIFAEVASHNHFSYEYTPLLYDKTAPIIKLKCDSKLFYEGIQAVMNSSSSCFYMKQSCQQKQLTGGDGVRVEFVSKVPYQFSGTAVGKTPMPHKLVSEKNVSDRISMLGIRMNKLVRSLRDLEPSVSLVEKYSSGSDFNKTFREAQKNVSRIESKMILFQEEIDWVCYWGHGLCDESLLTDIDKWCDVDIKVGQRPFEILSGINQDGFEVPSCVPAHWPKDMQSMWRTRMDVIRNIREIKVIEDPHYKRRWIGRQGLFNHAAHTDELRVACKEWLLKELEKFCQKVEIITCAQLAERVRSDAAFQQVAAYYQATDTFDTQTLVSDLVAGDNAPQMAAARYKSKAMPKFRAWQETWDKQRAEDAIDARTELNESDPRHLSKEEASALKAQEIGDIPLPPKYAANDFRKPSYWPLRGKLDVPKERFFSMPNCEKDGDSTLVIGWAGLNHLQRAQAIAAWYLDRKEQEGWEAERLKPMLVALDELIPWLKQWHNEIDPEFGERMGDYYEGFLLEELRQLDLSRDELLTWEPPAATRRGGRRRRA